MKNNSSPETSACYSIKSLKYIKKANATKRENLNNALSLSSSSYNFLQNRSQEAVVINNDTILYDKTLAPNEIFWLLLSLPAHYSFSKVNRELHAYKPGIELRIPDTMIFGLSENPVLIRTDSSGHLQRKKGAGEDDVNDFFKANGKALEKASYVQEIEPTEHKRVTSRSLLMFCGSKEAHLSVEDVLDRLSLDHNETATLGNYRIQKSLNSKRKGFWRVTYRVGEKPTVLSYVENYAQYETPKSTLLRDCAEAFSVSGNPVDIRDRTRSSSLLDARNAVITTSLNQPVTEIYTDTRDQPFSSQQDQEDLAFHMNGDTIEDERLIDDMDPEELTEIETDGHLECHNNIEYKPTSSRLLSDVLIAGDSEMEEDEQEKLAFAVDATVSALAPTLTETSQEKGLLEGGDSDDEISPIQVTSVPVQELMQRWVDQRILKPFQLPHNSTTEIHHVAAENALVLVERIAKHIGMILKRKVKSLIVDFIRNSDNQLVLTDILGFDFFSRSDDEKDTLPLILPPSVSRYLEYIYDIKIDFNPIDSCIFRRSSAIGQRRNSLIRQLSSIPTLMTSSLPIKKIKNVKKLFVDNRVSSCKLCERKVPITESKLYLTTKQIKMTMYHIRARLPKNEWPIFCQDENILFRILLRRELEQEKLSSDKQASSLQQNESQVCSLCFAIFNQEMELIKAEKQLAAFISNRSIDTSIAGESIMTSSLKLPTPLEEELFQEKKWISKNATDALRSADLSQQKEITKLLTAYEKEKSNRELLRKPRRKQHLDQQHQPPAGSPDIILRKQSTLPTLFENDGGSSSEGQNSDSISSSSTTTATSTSAVSKLNKGNGEDFLAFDLQRGRIIQRADLIHRLTLSRALFAFTKITDLPPAFVDAYDNFRLSYSFLGTLYEVPCHKAFSVMQSQVASLEVKFLRISYMLNTGDGLRDVQLGDERPGSLGKFLSVNRRILVLLLANKQEKYTMKPTDWILPSELLVRKKNSDDSATPSLDSPSFRPVRKASISAGGPSPGGKRMSVSLVDPGAVRQRALAIEQARARMTLFGDKLPEDAVAYCYLTLENFRAADICKMDINSPLAYCIQTLPRSRNVPALMGSIGVQRLRYPVDPWSLPKQLLDLGVKGQAIIPLKEAEMNFSDPLPTDWLIATGVLEKKPHAISSRISGRSSTGDNLEILQQSLGRDKSMNKAATQILISLNKERRLETSVTSVWCVCVVVGEASHLASNLGIPAASFEWRCEYELFGEKVSLTCESYRKKQTNEKNTHKLRKSMNDNANDEDLAAKEHRIVFDCTSRHLVVGSGDYLVKLFDSVKSVRFSMHNEDQLISQPSAASALKKIEIDIDHGVLGHGWTTDSHWLNSNRSDESKAVQLSDADHSRKLLEESPRTPVSKWRPGSASGLGTGRELETPLIAQLRPGSATSYRELHLTSNPLNGLDLSDEMRVHGLLRQTSMEVEIPLSGRSQDTEEPEFQESRMTGVLVLDEGLGKSRSMEGLVRLSIVNESDEVIEKVNEALYPAYLSVFIEIFRIGPRDDFEWYPPNTVPGPLLCEGIRKLNYVGKAE